MRKHLNALWLATTQPVEYVLYPSLKRFRVVGWFACIVQLLTYFAWTTFAPQPFDNFWLRLGLACLGIPFLLSNVVVKPFTKSWQIYATLFCWVELPLFMTLMYYANGRNWEWLVCLSAMPLIYYHLVDWRIATSGIALAWGIGAVCSALGLWAVESPPGIGFSHGFVFLFCWVAALGLRVSAANLRREQTAKTLETIAFVAHEMRTPISAVAMIAQNLRAGGELDKARAEEVGALLDNITGKMHAKIDRVLTNARVQTVVQNPDVYDVFACVKFAVDKFAYANDAARNAVEVFCLNDFQTLGSRQEMGVVIGNLLSNAFAALSLVDQPLTKGDIKVSVDCASGGMHGSVLIEDRGAGISKQNMSQIFDAYFTTRPTMGLGLGLAFCKSALTKAKGKITVKSQLGNGTSVMLTLPVAMDRGGRHPSF